MKAFISYSHRDEAMLDRLHAHLAVSRRKESISEWYDREIVAGARIDVEILSDRERRESERQNRPISLVRCPDCKRTDVLRGWY